MIVFAVLSICLSKAICFS